MKLWAALGGVVCSVALAGGLVVGDGQERVRMESQEAGERAARDRPGDVLGSMDASGRAYRAGQRRLARPGFIDIRVHGTTQPASRPVVLVVDQAPPGWIDIRPAATQPVGASASSVDKP